MRPGRTEGTRIADDREITMVEALTYHKPGSTEEALRILHSLGAEAKILAGGQDIVPLMNQGKLAPRSIVDLKELTGLLGVWTRNGSMVVGALTTHRGIERSEHILARCGLLADAAGQIGGGVQVRNRGTIGGAICAGNPAYDFAPCLVALGAEFQLLSVNGERRVAAADFFVDAHTTALRPNELLAEIIIPIANSAASFAYQKLKFSDGCYCIASAACVLELNPDGSCGLVRLVLGGVSPTPIRLSQVETLVAGSQISEELLAKVTAAAQQSVGNPINDVQADGEYRRAMAGVMARRALARAFQRALPKKG